ncbi:MAG: DUF4007 family protein [Candidatus Dadabacteria bacterium]|nr:MAG: DUF4007 family protein [Candidatus Dadabacteria bacterium]
MRFSGHETFSIREGWLHKGLRLVYEDGAAFGDPYVADRLGVGKNMAKSIRHWLLATGLVEVAAGGRKSDRAAALQVTRLGDLILDRDPYFLEPMTWWVLHTNLVHNPERVTSWWWFFNVFRAPRFEKAGCVEALRLFIEAAQKRVPSPRTLDRDVSCLLRSYARELPPPTDYDPEEAYDCPFSEFGLLTHFRSSGSYRMNFGGKDIPGEALGYCLARAFPRNEASSEAYADVSLEEAVRMPGGPGAVFALSEEPLFEWVQGQEHANDLCLTSAAGERFIRYRRREPLAWLLSYYDRVAARGRKGVACGVG